MFKWIPVILLAACALFMTYRDTWILEKIFKIESPAPNQILRVKLVALGIGLLLFIAVMLWF